MFLRSSLAKTPKSLAAERLQFFFKRSNIRAARVFGFAFCNAEIRFLVLVIDGQRLANFQDGFVWKFVFLTTEQRC
jgi:hypothetical protein